jgi:hypothetical protein
MCSAGPLIGEACRTDILLTVKSASTYVGPGRAALLVLCVVLLSGCGNKSQINEFRDGLKTLPATYSADYSFKGGPLSGPGYVFGKLTDSDGTSLFFCAHANSKRVMPLECRAMKAVRSCERLTLATDVKNAAGRLSRAERATRVEMADQLNELLDSTGAGCAGST